MDQVEGGQRNEMEGQKVDEEEEEKKEEVVNEEEDIKRRMRKREGSE